VLPWIIVDRAPTPDGAELVLARRGDEWVIRVDRELLMSSRAHYSEEALAVLALERAPRARDVLIGGLGLGFTLRAALDRLPAAARVVVAELSATLVGWNRGPLAPLAGHPLADRRVRVVVGDVGVHLAARAGAWDAILLDLDNGPRALCLPSNDRLYGDRGIAALWAALRPGGVLGVWSAGPADLAWRDRLRRAGFAADVRHVPARPGGGAHHVLFFAQRPLRATPRPPGGAPPDATSPEARAPRRPGSGAHGGGARGGGAKGRAGGRGSRPSGGGPGRGGRRPS
jgi:predicted membrane-bound spermidine synthase